MEALEQNSGRAAPQQVMRQIHISQWGKQLMQYKVPKKHNLVPAKHSWGHQNKALEKL